MPKGDFSVARVGKRTRESVGKFERHIERKNESYENMNVDLSRTPMNVHFQGCGELTYNEHLDRLIADGTVSLKGLKADATVFNEMILDVNTDYFERNGGYDFACRFYEEAFHFAEKLYGKDNIISAVMHADELNIAMTEKYGKPVYHYHLHIMALPVVDKEVRWSKRCKDPALVGTVKEVIHQVSHSKKWKSEKALDENGNPKLNSNGKPVYFRVGDKVMQTKNNAKASNGDIGYIRKMGRNAKNEMVVTIEFSGDRIAEYGMEEMGYMELAYATTVHKAMGSEFDIVIMPILRSHYIILGNVKAYIRVAFFTGLQFKIGSYPTDNIYLCHSSPFCLTAEISI